MRRTEGRIKDHSVDRSSHRNIITHKCVCVRYFYLKYDYYISDYCISVNIIVARYIHNFAAWNNFYNFSYANIIKYLHII